MKLIQPPKSPELDHSFEIQTTQVTQELYKEVMGVNPSYFQGDPKLPVEKVSWFDAITFCNRASELQHLEPCYETRDGVSQWNKQANGFRLPAETEWEYAYLAGEPDPIGPNLLTHVWCHENANSKTHPVGLKLPNQWGLYDMLGNVWEWCWDHISDYRVVRGGSFYYVNAAGLRASYRSHYAPAYRNDGLGVRCVRTILQY